jgi:hypothetical protein
MGETEAFEGNPANPATCLQNIWLLPETHL